MNDCFLQTESDFVDGEVLPTLLMGSNLTILVDEVNSTEIVTVVSYASEAIVVTPAAYACNVSVPFAYSATGMHHRAPCCIRILNTLKNNHA